jgi:G3E family GTPase
MPTHPSPAKDEPMNQAVAVPMTVLTGFLGSGKTTLLKRLLEDPAMAGTAVIINEFGEVGIDDALVEKGDDTVLLPSGCVCCAVRGDLVEALVKLHLRALAGEIPPLIRVVLETSGLADPTPIVHTLMTEERVYRTYQLDAVVTLVDGQHGLSQIDEHFEPARQIAIADRIVISKSDIAEAGTLQRLQARVKALNPAAEVTAAVKGDIAPSALIGLGAHEPVVAGTDTRKWLAAERYSQHAAAHGHQHGPECAPDCGHDHHHDHAHAGHDHGAGHDQPHDCADPTCAHPAHVGHLHGISSFCLTFSKPLEGAEVSNALQLLGHLYGPNVLRVKGILDVVGQEKPFVVHGVQHIFYPPDTLESWPGSDRRSKLVFITKDPARGHNSPPLQTLRRRGSRGLKRTAGLENFSAATMPHPVERATGLP